MKSIFFLAILVFLSKSCDDESSAPTERFDTISVNVKQGELIEYDTSIDNFLGAVYITDSTKYHIISELFSDSTDLNVHHRYQPLDTYLGNDTLKLRSSIIDDTSNETISIKNLTVVLTVE